MNEEMRWRRPGLERPDELACQHVLHCARLRRPGGAFQEAAVRLRASVKCSNNPFRGNSPPGALNMPVQIVPGNLRHANENIASRDLVVRNMINLRHGMKQHIPLKP